jgi:two-component system sensor histidine kinase DesK
MIAPRAAVRLARWPALTPSRWAVVAVTLVVVALAPIFTLSGLPGAPATGSPNAVVPLAAAALALQVRHGLAVSRGGRPPGARWTVLALASLAYAPLPWFGWNWVAMQMCAMASVPLLLSGQAAALGIALPALGSGVAALVTYESGTAWTDVGGGLYALVYQAGSLLAGAAALYGVARLVALTDELHDARTEVAASALLEERRRIARDLHDLLGQSLAAISLKGELAKRLLPRDPEAAGSELESVASLAENAQNGLTAVSRGALAVSVAVEAASAQALLSAAGVDVRLRLDIPTLSESTEQTLAWAIREGVANVLRHSQAHTCSITAGRSNHRAFMEIVNDGAPGEGAEGGGLSGLRERARAVSGSVTTHRAGGCFTLRMEIPWGPS